MLERFSSSYAHIQTKMQEWFLHHAKNKYADAWLFALSFAESSFFPIPPDPFLIALLIADSSHWFRHAFSVTIASVAGGIFGYAIGAFFFDVIGAKIVAAYSLEVEMEYVRTLFVENAFWAIFTAAFTPIPYKLFTISAGFFKIDLVIFIVASLVGRGSRFFIVAYLMRRFGEKIGGVVFRYLNIFSLLFALYIIFIVVSLKIF